MRLQVPTTILALLPLAISGNFENQLSFDDQLSFKDPFSTPSHALALRAASPIGNTALNPADQPDLLVTNFDAFMPSPAYATNFSRAAFNVRLMHQDLQKRWTMRCFAHTRSALCGLDAWGKCVPLNGKPIAGETVMFRLGDDLSRLDIWRMLDRENVHMRMMASEPANWVKKVDEDDFEGNLTVSEMGSWYKRPEGWKFIWRQAVG